MHAGDMHTLEQRHFPLHTSDLKSSGVINACAGQSHNEYFQFARTGRATYIVGTATAIDEAGVRLADGTLLPADMVVYCGGFDFQQSPAFLAELGLGECSPCQHMCLCAR
jgi:hypothetical protein